MRAQQITLSPTLQTEAERDIATEGEITSIMVRMVDTAVINSPEAYAWATDTLKAIAARHDDIEAKRKSWVGPLTNVTRNINAFFKPTTDAYKRAEQSLKSKMLAYMAAQEQTRVLAMQSAAPVTPPVIETVEGVQVRRVRRWRVTNPELVPAQFCSPDPVKIQAHLDNGGLEAIRGVEFYWDETLAVSRRG